jgi:hypothetical protein
MAEGAPKRGLGFLFIVLGVAGISAGMARLHGTPALLSEVSGGFMLVLGIGVSLRK